MRKVLSFVILLYASIFVCGSVSGATSEEIRGLWDISSLKKTPVFRDADLKEDGVKGIFVEGLPCKGRKTEFFAWYGIPKNVEGRVPGIVSRNGKKNVSGCNQKVKIKEEVKVKKTFTYSGGM